jgi:hypothetical protein
MSDDLRFRLKSKQKPNEKSGYSKKSADTDSSDSIFGIWAEQNRMQAEEDKMARELAATKKKAKELSKTLRTHRYGEVKQETFNKLTSITGKFKKFFGSLLSIFIVWSKNHRKPALGMGALFIIATVIVGYYQLKPTATTATLGDSTSSSNSTSELPEEKLSFTILFPSNSREADFDVKRTNPEGSATAYTYLDSFTEADPKFQISQQKIPDNFNLEKTANDFQATDIIQIDGDKVYHGFSEKVKVQSLIFVKKDRLVLISSPQKFTDDQWANYILSLK